ncbi:MAG: metal-sensitive transcriptional regulator [bacterium]|nr:metal-sensitive transcriptional regulator [bacterium]
MDQLDKRVSRILGQMRGIQNMVKEERDCIEILQQMSAVKKAIDGLSLEIISLYMKKELTPDQAKKFEKIINRAIEL